MHKPPLSLEVPGQTFPSTKGGVFPQSSLSTAPPGLEPGTFHFSSKYGPDINTFMPILACRHWLLGRCVILRTQYHVLSIIHSSAPLCSEAPCQAPLMHTVIRWCERHRCRMQASMQQNKPYPHSRAQCRLQAIDAHAVHGLVQQSGALRFSEGTWVQGSAVPHSHQPVLATRSSTCCTRARLPTVS